MNKLEPDCTKRCKSHRHGEVLTSAVTKRSVSDISLASFIKTTCFNFNKSFDHEGRTVLHMAASRGRNILMDWLAKHSSEAFINIRDRESGYTPLHRSIFYGQIHSAVSLMKLGCNIEILDKDDYKPLEFAMLDRQYICKVEKSMPCDVYVWGSNSNYTLGTGSHQPKHVPDMLTLFNRSNEDVKQVCLGKFHSVWVCASGTVWCAGQPSRAGGSTNTALRPTFLRLPEPCKQVALTLTSTIFLLQSGAMIQYASSTPENSIPSTKVSTVRHQISNPLGVSAGRCHAVLWNANAVYTWGQNMGQLGHQAEEKFVPTPKRVAISMNNKEDTKFVLVDASDAATVVTTSRGDVYLLHKYICKKIAVKQINLQQVCVDAKVSETGIYTRVTVLLLTTVGQLMIWQDVSNRLTRCVFGVSHQVKTTHVALTHDALYFTTKYGEAFIGHISRKTTPPPAQPIRKEKDKDNKSALAKFLEKDDCTSVKITKIPNIHRAISIAVDNEGLNFACLQNKATCGLVSVPELSPSSFSKHLDSLLETASDDDILHDVVFKIGLKLFPAHMFIIASSSEHLYKLYQEARVQEKIPTIMLENVLADAFERVLKYIYTGTCDVAELGPCGLKIRKDDLVGTREKPVESDDVIENPSDISAFEVYKNHDKRKNNRRRPTNNGTPTRTHIYCDPVKLVQATAKRLQVMGLHKLLDKFYYRDGNVCVKESATYTKNAAPCWDRDSCPELVDTNVCSKDGMLISAHKCVLAARLEYFNGMFMHSWTESKLLSNVTIPINHGILLPVINFLYTDKCPEIESSDSIDFICSMLIVSDQLFIGRLREMCEVALANLITLKNCTELCQFAHTYNATQLKQCCMEYISLNFANILENRLLDPLEDILLEDITKYYCKFNPIMSFRVITPFSNAPDDATIEDSLRNYPIDLEFVDEECKKESFHDAKKKGRSKKVEYTDNEKARMRYESVSSVTSLDESSGDIKLSLTKICKENNKSKENVDKWTVVSTSQQKQQKLVQARLKAISAAKDILNETPMNTFTRLSKSSPTQESPTTSRMSISPKESPINELVNRNSHGNLVINHVGPKLSQKQRKKLAFDNSTPQTLDNYLSNKLNIGSPPEKPKNPWKIIEAPVASSSPKGKVLEFNQILADQQKQKDDSSRIMTKSLILTQLEDKAIEELERFYNVHGIDDELITVSRIELQVSSPQWIHTAPKL